MCVWVLQVFVANHASWMDVPYAGLLPHASKYFAKSDLAKVPVLGWSMLLSGHIMVDRDDKRSQVSSQPESSRPTNKPTTSLPMPACMRPARSG